MSLLRNRTSHNSNNVSSRKARNIAQTLLIAADPPTGQRPSRQDYEPLPDDDDNTDDSLTDVEQIKRINRMQWGVIALLALLSVFTIAGGATGIVALARHNSLFTMFMTNMFVFNQLEHTESGVIPPTHNVHYLVNETSPLSMTLPSDLTPYIGKNMEICAVGQGSVPHTVTLEGITTWDSQTRQDVTTFDPIVLDVNLPNQLVIISTDHGFVPGDSIIVNPFFDACAPFITDIFGIPVSEFQGTQTVVTVLTDFAFTVAVSTTPTPPGPGFQFPFFHCGYSFTKAISKYSTIQLGANDATPCCVKFSVISENEVDVTNKNCATFCTSSDAIFCVDPENPFETSPWHGWWRASTKAAVTDEPYMFFDATKEPAVAQFYRGSVNNPREISTTDVVFVGVRQLPVFPITETTLSTEKSGFPCDFCVSMNLQPDGESLTITIAANGGVGDFHQQDSNILFSKAPEPDIITLKTGTLDGDLPDDPVRRLRQLEDLQLWSGNGYIRKDLESETFIGRAAAKGLMDDIIDNGVSVVSNVHKVWTTVNPAIPVTRVRTETYPSAYGKVTISGCTGAWAALNGERFVSTSGTTSNKLVDPLFEDYNATDPNARTVHHDVLVWFDSTGLPTLADGTGNETGPCVVTASYGPINSASNYIDTISAYVHWVQTVFPGTFHQQWQQSPNPLTFTTRADLTIFQLWSTWEDVIKHTAFPFDELLPQFMINKLRGSVAAYSGKQFVNNFFGFGSTGDIPLVFMDSRFYGYTDVNDRFGIGMDSGLALTQGPFPLTPINPNPLSYDTVINNYLIDVKVPYFRCIGGSKFETFNFVAGDNYGTGLCDTFESVLLDFDGPAPTDSTLHLMHRQAPTNIAPPGFPFGGPAFYPFFQNAIPPLWDALQRYQVVGRINTTFTGGKSIGYIRMEVDAGDQFGNSFLVDLAPTLGGPRDSREAAVKMFSSFMTYLVGDLQCEHVIVDIRGSTGGSDGLITVFRELFGSIDQRIRFADLRARTDPGTGIPIDLSTLKYHNNEIYDQLDALNIAYPSYTVSQYGANATFTGGNVVIVVDSSASSSTNELLGTFLCLDGSVCSDPREIGSNTHVKIIGDVDGRAFGCAAVGNVPISTESGLIRKADGTVISAMDTAMDGSCEFFRADGITAFANRHPALAPDCAPTLKGLAGGCPLPNDLETLTYPDVGLATNTRARLVGDTRPIQPVFGDPATRRDAWLEQAIESALDTVGVFLTNAMATVNGSAVVTITSTAHGFSNSDVVTVTNVALPVDGIHIDEFNTHHVISGVTTNAFNITVTTTATATSAATGGDFAIAKRDLGAKKRSVKDKSNHYTQNMKRRVLSHTRGISRRDVGCPSGVTLTPIAEMPATFSINVTRDNLAESIALKHKIFAGEIRAGGICMDDDDNVMVTPSCKFLPRFSTFTNYGVNETVVPEPIRNSTFYEALVA